MNIQRVSLDVSKVVTGTQYARIGQDDSSGTTIVASVYDNGAEFDMSGMTAVFCMKLPGKMFYVRDESCSVSGNQITYVVNEEYCCAVSGMTDIAYFEIHQGGGVIASTGRFKIDVLASARAGSYIGGSYDPYIQTELERIMADLEEEVEEAIARGMQYELPVATTTLLGGVKVDGNTITITKDGVISGSSRIEPDDLGLEQDKDTLYVYPTYRGVRSSTGIPLQGGGGGGGGGGNAASFSMRNATGWISTAISEGGACTISVTWSSIEDQMETGDGTMVVTVNDVVRLRQNVSQGAASIDAGGIVSNGTNSVKVQISDVYGNSRTIIYTIEVYSLTISSQFSTAGTFAANKLIQYTYTPVGAVAKTVHFILDNNEVGTSVVTASGRQQTYNLPGVSHGEHLLRVYFTANIDGNVVSSNVLSYSLIVVDEGAGTPIVSVSFDRSTVQQYETVNIPYKVYTPGALTSSVTLYANNRQVNRLTVDRTEQVWSYRASTPGALELRVETGSVARTLNLIVAPSSMDIEAETDQLALYLTSHGRSNNEGSPDVWEDEHGDTRATMTGFDFVSNGWVADSDGVTALKVSGGARVTIPYLAFRNDFRSTGKTIEFEFATADILDYDTTVISCMSGGKGFELTAQLARLRSEQVEVMTQYKEDEHVRVSFVIEKRSEDRLIFIYINGIVSGCIRYPEDDNFSQSSPVGITIGSDHCSTYIYNIRIYDNDLTRYQIVDNWIADTQDVATMIDRYTHNDVYDDYGQITIANLPNDLPYFVLEAAELPQYKGDKKTITGRYVDPADRNKSFTFTGCQINVQGTSSAAYARKNYDMQFKKGFEMADGTHADTFALAPTVIPFNRFVLKADVASSEGANNVELTMLYNEIDPYTRPEQLSNPMVRKGIYGFPIVAFWHDTNSGETKFLGRFNFNLPKRAPEPYGYTGDMESWEFQNNTSNLMLFLTDYFDETMVVDPTTGDAKEAWRYDYEARFPEDTWTNYAKLQEFESFVYSTYRANATNAALPSPYTDVDGNVHTTDSAAYRLARFRTEFGRYAEVQSFLFYYIFTELFLMVDSRAKNLFIGFSGGNATGLTAIDRKAIAEPYDMDTALGIEAA